MTETLARRAQMNAWYAANRERHKARQRVRYAAKRQEVLAGVHAYRRTAAGMLAMARHDAKNRRSA